jgi:hypothetical protein
MRIARSAGLVVSIAGLLIAAGFVVESIWTGLTFAAVAVVLPLMIILIGPELARLRSALRPTWTVPLPPD